MPSRPPSRPNPDCLTPPNGAAGLETMPWLRPTIPVSRRSHTRSARWTSRGESQGRGPRAGARVGDDALVEADHPGVEALAHAQCPLDVAREDVGHEAELGVVGGGD